jgi:uncharacterized alkaline shock family protein YloU
MAKKKPAPAPGSTSIAPEVLLNLARLTTLSVEGVSRMAQTPSQFRQWAQPRQVIQGVEVDIEGERVDVDIYAVLKNDVNLRQVSRTIQQEVARALSEMVGMQAGRINIHIEDIDYPNGN